MKSTSFLIVLIAWVMIAASACGTQITPPSITDVPYLLTPVYPSPALTDDSPAVTNGVIWVDASAVFEGLCFESVYDAAGQIFTLRADTDVTALFDLADNSQLCRRSVVRGTFDFAGGRVLIGTWSRGDGCSARHDIIDIDRDDVARVVAIQAQFITDGTCNYELVRPLWIALENITDYDIRLRVDS